MDKALAVFEKDRGDQKGFIAELRLELEENPTNERAWTYLITTEMAARQYDDALQSLGHLEKIYDRRGYRSADLYWWRLMTFFLKGDYKLGQATAESYREILLGSPKYHDKYLALMDDFKTGLLLEDAKNPK